MTDATSSYVEQVEALQNLMVAVATGGASVPSYYRELRQVLTSHPTIGPRLPRFVRTCRDETQFWQFIKHEYGTYKERRQFIWGAFRPLLEELDSEARAPSDETTSTVLRQLDEAHVHELWQKALERRSSDPEGAITAARTLLETVCKYILDSLPVTYSTKDDLPKLYGLTANALNLAPSQHTEETFKAILGGCWTVVTRLGTLRNRLSDAHGKGRKPVKPEPRHAELAVNLAGSMATFLVATWQERHAGESVNPPADPLRSGTVEPVMLPASPLGT